MKRIFGAMLATFILAGVAFAFALPRGQAAAIVGDTTVTAAGAGVFPAGATFSGVQLAGGTFGVGAQIPTTGAVTGDLEVQLNGTSLIGLSEWITVTGWITSGAVNPDGSVTLNGTCTLDMGDGTPPTGGLALVANLSAAGVTLTVGSTVLPTLPKSDGWFAVE